MAHHTKADRSLTVVREFDAPREQVWKAWTDPKLLAQWFAPQPLTVPTAEADVWPGGKYRLVMRDENGTEYPSTGEYREVTPPEKLVYTDSVAELPQEWKDQLNAARGAAPGTPVKDGVVTVTFEAISDGNRTKVTFDAEYDSKKTVDAYKAQQMVEGLEGSFVNLDRVLRQPAMVK